MGCCSSSTSSSSGNHNSSSPSGGGGASSQLGREMLAAHNTYRSRHSAPPLRWSSEAAAAADEWAKRLARLGRLEHGNSSGMGQNLYMKGVVGAALELSGQEVVESWYNEIQKYDFNRPGFSGGTGHFTQVVWIGTTHMGAASATRGNNIYVVANYSPPGNVLGQFPENVKRKR